LEKFNKYHINNNCLLDKFVYYGQWRKFNNQYIADNIPKKFYKLECYHCRYVIYYYRLFDKCDNVKIYNNENLVDSYREKKLYRTYDIEKKWFDKYIEKSSITNGFRANQITRVGINSIGYTSFVS
jgi:hypothetical protein